LFIRLSKYKELINEIKSQRDNIKFMTQQIDEYEQELQKVQIERDALLEQLNITIL